jgi:putative tricarboxylic transport membrane protein
VTRELNADRVFGVVSLAIAAIYFALARAIPSSLLDDVVGSRGLPMVYGVVLAALALTLIARSFLARRSGSQTAQEVSTNARTAGILALGVGYGALLPWLGYAGSIALLLLGTAMHEGARLSGRVVIVAVCGAAFLWGLFVWLLGIPQPSGIWSSF